MKASHTPGPWHLGLRQAEQIVYNAAGWAVANATVYHGKQDVEECKANARLIAAAPDLLAALEGIFENCAMVHKHWGEGSNAKGADAAIRAAQDAIKSARGAA